MPRCGQILARFADVMEILVGLISLPGEGMVFTAGTGVVTKGITTTAIKNTDNVVRLMGKADEVLPLVDDAAKTGVDIVGTNFNKVLPTQDYINPLEVANTKH